MSIIENELDRYLQLLARAGLAGAWWKAAGMPDPGVCEAEIGKHRVADGKESDVRLEAPGMVLLVEHKIGDPFRAGQPEGYQAEVQRYHRLGLQAAAIVVAPQAHLDILDPKACSLFDGVLALEDASDSLGDVNVFVRIITNQMRSAGVVATSSSKPEMVAFGGEYRKALAVLDVGLRISPGSFDRGSIATFEQLPGAGYLMHTMSGKATLTLLPDSCPGIAPPSGAIMIAPNGGNRKVTFKVPTIDMSRPLNDQLDAFLEAISSVEILRDWWLNAMRIADATAPLIRVPQTVEPLSQAQLEAHWAICDDLACMAAHERKGKS